MEWTETWGRCGEKRKDEFLMSIFAYRFQERRIKYYLNFCHRTCKNLINKRLSYESENVWLKKIKKLSDLKKFEKMT